MLRARLGAEEPEDTGRPEDGRTGLDPEPAAGEAGRAEEMLVSGGAGWRGGWCWPGVTSRYPRHPSDMAGDFPGFLISRDGFSKASLGHRCSASF